MTLTKEQKEELYSYFKEKTDSGELIYISPNDAPKYRKEFWVQQNKKCAVLDDEIDFIDSTLDHCHKKESDFVGINGKGLVRSVLHKSINVLEGKIWNTWRMSKIKNKYKLQDVLRGLIKYYDMIEQGTLPIEQKYIYPNEKPEEPKEIFTKNQYNKIKKYYFKVFPRRKTLPKKTKYLTEEIKEYIRLIDEYRKNK